MNEQRSEVNGLAPITNVALMMELLETLQSRPPWLPGLGVFSGPAGWGKTTAATVAANVGDAVVIEIDDTYTKKHFFMVLARELNLSDRGTIAELSERVAMALIDSDRPLIIDEADHLLRRGMIESVRGLLDKTKGVFILIGEELLPSNLKRWERVHSRVLQYVQAQPLSDDDARVLCNLYCPGVVLGGDLFEALVEKTRRSARRLSNNLYLIKERARREGKQEMALADFPLSEIRTGEAPATRRISE